MAPDRNGAFAGCDLRLSPAKRLAFLAITVAILAIVAIVVTVRHG